MHWDRNSSPIAIVDAHHGRWFLIGISTGVSCDASNLTRHQTFNPNRNKEYLFFDRDTNKTKGLDLFWIRPTQQTITTMTVCLLQFPQRSNTIPRETKYQRFLLTEKDSFSQHQINGQARKQRTNKVTNQIDSKMASNNNNNNPLPTISPEDAKILPNNAPKNLREGVTQGVGNIVGAAVGAAGVAVLMPYVICYVGFV